MKAIRLSLLALLLALPLQATVFTVTKALDTLDGACDQDCSLREAVSAANAADTEGGADVIVVPAGFYFLSRFGIGEDDNATGDLDLLDSVILVGAGAGSTTLHGFGSDRLLDVRARAEIFGVTLVAGVSTGDGGALLVRPGSPINRVLLRRSLVYGNVAEGGNGGGIAVHGHLEVSESAIYENFAHDGGGISAGPDGFLSLTNSTVSDNEGNGNGAGVAFTQGRAVISGSTIVFNRTLGSGGGIFARAALVQGTFPPAFQGSIIAGNLAGNLGNQIPEDCAGPAQSAGYNVIGVAGSCNLEPTDKRGTLESPLQAVFRNRSIDLGPTAVHKLVPGSPAFDMVPGPHCGSSDQVGQARTAPCEAGAWERAGHPLCVPGGTILCLQDGRFRVSLSLLETPFIDRLGLAVPLTDDTGNYWFFGPENLEVMVKVLDGCAVNQRWWVFSSGLTDVGFGLRVEDLETGRIRENVHRAGSTYPPRLDTSAFPCALSAQSAAGESTALATAGPAVSSGSSEVLVVTKTVDTDDGVCDHDCSLREAVLAANLSGAGVIILGQGVYTLSIGGIAGGGEDLSHTGDLDITGNVVVLGAGATRTVVDGGGIDRVLEVRSTGSLELYGVTVRNGWARSTSIRVGVGGGIVGLGPLKLVGSQVTGNRSEDQGGGIFAYVLKIRDSTVYGNIADTSGGGIVAVAADLENVTVSGNQAGNQGGGVYLYLYQVSLRNVTITGNSASLGGGIAVILEDCVGHSCYDFFEMERTVIAGNAGNTLPDCVNLPLHGGGFNLFGVGAGCNPGIDDQFGTLANPIDARLTPLGEHGGPTLTHALLPDSRAIDLAPASPCPDADQRGRLRPADGNLDGVAGCDAGAVEHLPSCQPDENALCLGEGGRFRATARWTVFPQSASARTVPLTLDTGAFWFFDPANLELTVKVVEGCGTNNRYWVFLSGLTDVGVQVTVEDTKTGNTWTHSHAAGTPLQARLDTNAFACVEP
jgi:CSLREA domain-containing protein